MKVHNVSQDDFDWDDYQRDCPKFRKNYYKQHKVYPTTKPISKEDYSLLLESIENLTIPEPKDIVKGVISEINGKFAHVDIGWREPAIVDISKESNEYVENFFEGSEIDLILKDFKLSKRDGSINASHTDVVKHIKYQELFDNIGNPVAYPAYVKELIHGGYFLDIEGIEVFMPGSLGGVNKLVDFEELLGKTINVVPINYSPEKKYIVVSHRDYLQTLIPNAIDNISVGDSRTGFITGTTKFGVFCEFDDCLTGLIHKTDLDEETFELYENRNLNPGDELTFNIKEIGRKNRIILSQKPVEIKLDPWENILEKYPIPSNVQGTVRKKTRYGIFVQLEKKIVGLLHISDIPKYIDLNEIKEGNLINVDVVKIDTESKKIFLKI